MGLTNKRRTKFDEGKIASRQIEVWRTCPCTRQTDDSELLYRITTQDTDELMPPSEHGARLKPTEIALFDSGFLKAPSGVNIGLTVH